MAFFPWASCQKTGKVNSLQVAWALPEKRLLWLLMMERTLFKSNCGLLGFFVVVLSRKGGIDLCHSSIFIMSAHCSLTAFRSMLGTCHNPILFMWRLGRMPRHPNTSKRNTAALTDCAVALLAASHNLWLPTDLWWTETPSSAQLLLLWHLFLPQVASPFFQYLLKAKSFMLAQRQGLWSWEWGGEEHARKVMPLTIWYYNSCTESGRELVGALSSSVALGRRKRCQYE